MPVSTATPVGEGFHTITPFIAVPNAPQLIDFLKRTFGAQETSRHPHGEGFIASVKVDDTDLLIMGDQGLPGQERIGAFHVYVPDCDATYNRALEAGATSLGAPSDHSFGERAGYVKDPAGNDWYIATHLGPTPALQSRWTVTPFLHPASAPQYIDFLTRALGAKQLALYEHDGRVAYAAVLIGDAVIEMGEPHDAAESPRAGFYLHLEDCDAVYQRAIEAGATSLWPPTDQAWGERTAGLVDPFGYQWMPSTRIKDVR
jgi:PhnB protein